MGSMVMTLMLRLVRRTDKKGTAALQVTATCVAVQQAESHKCSMLPNHQAALAKTYFAVFAAIFSLSAPALAAESAWSPGPLSQARLLVAGGLDGAGTYRLAIEIALKGEAHTYWRMPGDAGVPPNLSTEGSQNVASAALLYPAPIRLEEAGLSVFGYRGALVLPLDVVPLDPAKPVHLTVAFSYAACEKICIPAEARASLDLTPKAPPSAEAGRVAQARVALPVTTANGGAVTLDVAKKEPASWHVRVAKPDEPWRDLFAEAPDGWYFETRRAANGFDLVAVEHPKDAKASPPVTLTLAGEAHAYEVKLVLP
ncbi:MAG: hypothetical protein JWL62_1897 [Hyphomicrobiales bacterium]|nr:hypothetical protein [Hyphomicrobiales bacterium]